MKLEHELLFEDTGKPESFMVEIDQELVST